RHAFAGEPRIPVGTFLLFGGASLGNRRQGGNGGLLSRRFRELAQRLTGQRRVGIGPGSFIARARTAREEDASLIWNHRRTKRVLRLRRRPSKDAGQEYGRRPQAPSRQIAHSATGFIMQRLY